MFKKIFQKFILFFLIIISCSACSLQNKDYFNTNNNNPKIKEKLVEEISENVKQSIKDDLKKYINNQIEKKNSIFEHPIDVELGKCIERDSTTAGMRNCGYISIRAWNNEIDRHLKNLKDILTAEQYTLVQDSQAKWEEYKQKEVETLKKLVLEHEGTIYQVSYVAQYNSLVKDRAILLNYYEWIYSEDKY